MTDFIFLGSKITADGDYSHEIKRPLEAPWKKSYDQPRQCIKEQRHHFPNKGPYSQGYVLSSTHVQMLELDHKEGWVSKNSCFRTMMSEKTLESPFDTEIKPVNPKGNQPWIFIGRTDTEAEAPLLWPPDLKIHLIGNVPDAGKDWRQEEKGVTEDEMVGWHHRLNGCEQTPGDSEGQGSLACCSPWGCKELDTTERWNWTELNLKITSTIN